MAFSTSFVASPLAGASAPSSKAVVRNASAVAFIPTLPGKSPRGLPSLPDQYMISARGGAGFVSGGPTHEVRVHPGGLDDVRTDRPGPAAEPGGRRRPVA